MSLATAQGGTSPAKDGDLPSAAAATSPRQASEDPFANLDPSLHPVTLNSVETEAQNPLTHFAQHVLDDHDGGLLGFNVDGDQGNALFTATGEARFGELLEAAGQSERVLEQQSTNGGHDDAFTINSLEAGAEGGHNEEVGEDGVVKMGRLVGRPKRRRDGEEIIVGPVENGEPIDPIKMKKDSHKEVERRRRENINDGINEIARLVPGGSEKMGKGMLLRRAADYLGDIANKMGRFDEELTSKDREKQTIQSELVHSQARLAEEHARSMRFETSWREAEDRAAASQFEVDRLKTEIEQLKKKLAEQEA
ncbi:Psilocybin cluster transcription regulator [Vanrija pseudolonga]|uniref:Psilocybin cluster transcription regulator n=1 Tax=Vanrija pseudolonga TaxID=143232 RepID=A0AAF0Y3D5_9TREE|nr:Psilocybin cluster transcription regulator [Vanrija pseudolonga]